jgi:hypothetical protein
VARGQGAALDPPCTHPHPSNPGPAVPAQIATYVGTGTLTERLRPVGSAQAAFNVATMCEAGLKVPMVWVDVEPYRVAPWSNSRASNNAVIDGVLAGYKAAGLRTGIYSYDGGWKLITEVARLTA